MNPYDSKISSQSFVNVNNFARQKWKGTLKLHH